MILNGRVTSLLDPVDASNVNRNTEIILLIGQAKEQDRWKASVGEKFLATFSDLFGGEGESSVRQYSSDLTRSVTNFLDFWFEAAKKRPSLSIRVVQASLSDRKPHSDVEESIVLATRKISEIFKISASHHFRGAQELFDKFSAAPSYDASLKYVEELERGNDKVALVRLADYFQFLCDEEGRLNEHFFEDNVRDYERGVSVNKQIMSTLEHPDGDADFWWLNNGVTMLVSEPPVSSRKEYALRDVQVVNGLQTSRTIYEWASGRAHIEDDSRAVLVRIIAPSGEDEKAKIIRATNSQTPVSKASLRATDEIHRRIEDILKLRGLFYDRRKNYYKNHGKSPREIVSITLLSQAMISAFLMRPDTARARPSSFLDNDDTYEDLFNPNRNMEEFCWAAATQKMVDETLSGSQYTLSERNNLRFYVLLVMRVLGSSKKTSKALWDWRPCPNDWFPDESDILSAASWVATVAGGMMEGGVSSDSVFKGSNLKDRLSCGWAAAYANWEE